MTEATEYGPLGLLGVLTPQANTTVEPELWALLPSGWSLANARLTSAKSTIEERLVDYTTKFESTAEQFANAPLTGLAAACTGASYLIGHQAEAELTRRIEGRFGVRFWTAARASTAMLKALGVRRLALLTPYPEGLNTTSITYWEGSGFTVVDHAGPEARSDRFHPIYAMQGSGVLSSYRKLSETDCDCVLMLGTGMATLNAILLGNEQGLRPAVSCNLALAWAATSADTLSPPTGWIEGRHWAKRLQTLWPDL